ncbi:MAG: hypothetical protein LBR80_09100 [Deltaproteobacteria bacterium]|nr:hypothetical protein [Deltaproteobacteria bacterium]
MIAKRILSGRESFSPDGRFDVVFCMMFPAARDDDSPDDAASEKLFGFSRKVEAFVGIAGHFPAPALEAVLAAAVWP